MASFVAACAGLDDAALYRMKQILEQNQTILSSWTGVGLVVGLLIMAAFWKVRHFKTDDIQKWLAKSKFGSLRDIDKRDQFQSLMEQQAALSKLAKD